MSTPRALTAATVIPAEAGIVPRNPSPPVGPRPRAARVPA